MTDFEEYFLSLPEPLLEEEQERLLSEYFETKDENIRNKLIMHNLRLCGKIAGKYHVRINSTKEELYSECCDCLITAIEQYNPTLSSNSSFSYFAINLMKKRIFRLTNNNNIDKVYLTESVVLDDDDDEVEIFNFIENEESRQFVKDLESSEFIQNVEIYIDKKIPEKWQDILKMYLGINHDKKYSIPELAKITGLSRQRLDIKIKQLIEKVKYFVINKDSLLKSRNVKLDKEKICEKLFNEYYGLNGLKVHSESELRLKYGLKGINMTIRAIDTKYIESGKYTFEEIEELKILRKEKKQKQTIDFYAYCYYSYYGLEGYARKSLAELAFELNYSISGINLAIKSFKDYLKMQSENKEEKIEDDQPTA